MCLADKKVPNHEANVIRKQLSDNFQKIYNMLDDAVATQTAPRMFPSIPDVMEHLQQSRKKNGNYVKVK